MSCEPNNLNGRDLCQILNGIFFPKGDPDLSKLPLYEDDRSYLEAIFENNIVIGWRFHTVLDERTGNENSN